MYKCYSNWPSNVTRKKPRNIIQIDQQVLLKLIPKCYSNLSANVTPNKPTNITQTSVNQIDPQLLREIEI